MTDEVEEFPQWGFWVMGSRSFLRNVSKKPHLFLTENTTACGYNPIVPKDQWIMHIRFSNVPKIGIYDVMFELKRGRRPTVDDFNKCKKCLKKEEKLNG